MLKLIFVREFYFCLLSSSAICQLDPNIGVFTFSLFIYYVHLQLAMPVNVTREGVTGAPDMNAVDLGSNLPLTLCKQPPRMAPVSLGS